MTGGIVRSILLLLQLKTFPSLSALLHDFTSTLLTMGVLLVAKVVQTPLPLPVRPLHVSQVVKERIPSVVPSAPTPLLLVAARTTPLP